MGQEATGSKDNDQTQILDEVGIESIKERIKQLRSEVETFTETKKQIELVLIENPERFKTHMDILRLQTENNNHRVITPTKQYETLPEYLELVTKTLEYKLIDEQRSFDSNIAKTKSQLEAVEGQLKSSQEQLNKELAVLKSVGIEG